MPKSHISQLFLRDAQFLLCTQTRLGRALTWSPVLLSFPDGNADREDMLFSLPPFPPPEWESRRVRVDDIHRLHTDRITSTDATHRPQSIRFFSSWQSRARKETSAYHGSGGYLETGRCPQMCSIFPPCTLLKDGAKMR